MAEVSPSQAAANASNAEALASQQAMTAESLRLNTAMAWLQMALALSGKISGR